MNVRRTFGLLLLCLISLAPVASAASNIVISQVYGGGGNAGATYRSDFIELFNRGTSTVNLTGWSVQYASSTGTTWQVTPLTGSIAPGQYFLVQQATGAGGTVNLPTPNVTGTITMSATAGKVALVSSTAALTGACPAAVDFVGFGAANCSEGTPTPTLANATAAIRALAGCTDTDVNSADFAVGAPTPRNTASPTNTCPGGDAPPVIGAVANPAATVTVDAAPFTVALTGTDDNNVFSWSATAGSGVTNVAVSAGQGTASATYTITLTPGFTGTASFIASLSDTVNSAVTRTVNIQVNPNVVNDPPAITAIANPVATVAQDAAPFTVNLSGLDDNGVYNWSATAGTGVSAVTVTAGQGTAAATFTVTLQPGFSGTASFNASLSDNFNAAVIQVVTVTVTPAPPPPLDHLVISQIYGGGGNASATFRNDYVELYNASTQSIDVGGWTIQYASSTGSAWQAQPLGGIIGPGQYYLIQLASGGAVGALLPVTPNVAGDINLSGTAGKVALVSTGDPLTGTCPIGDPTLVDLVGYGTANCREGATNAPAPSNTISIYRRNGGLTDTNVNGADFVTGAPLPRRTTPIAEIGPYVLNTDPRNNFDNVPRDASVSITFTETVDVTGAWFHIQCGITGAHNSATVAEVGRTWIITPNANFAPGETCTLTLENNLITDTDLDDSAPNTDALNTIGSWTFTVATGTAPAYSPDVHLTFGNPTDAEADLFTPDNYLMEKPEFTLSYNRSRGTANWVSWHLDDTWVGSLARVDTFRPDPAIPADWYRVLHTDYQSSGFDRGHMVPNADRDPATSSPINQATFLMTNMIPQSPDNNQGPWANLENYLRTLLPANEVYIVAGGAGTGGTGSNGFMTTLANGNVTVPAQTWKVALVLPKQGGDDVARVEAGTRTIAVIMPNIQGIRTSNPNDWQAYLTTVDAVEALTGYELFEHISDAVENAVEAGVNGVNPPGVDDQSVSTNEDAAQSFTLQAVSASANPLTYTILTQPAHGTLSGTGASQTYTPNADFNGTDTFTFRVNDGTRNSNVATMTVTVLEVNDAPVAADDAKSTNEDATLTFPAYELTSNDAAGPANESNQTLTVSSVSAPATLSNGTVTYTPPANFFGAASFTYEVCDNGVTGGLTSPQCTTATVHVNVVAVNDSPTVEVTAPDTGVEGSPLTASATGSDIDGDALTFAWTVTKNGAPFATGTGGSVTITPDDDGAYAFSVVATDATASGNGFATSAVSNVVPVIISTTGPAAALQLGASATIHVGYTDAGAADTHPALFTWADGSTSAGTCTAGACTATRTYAATGVYAVTIVVSDDDGGTAATTFRDVVVVNVDGGFVTGGGFIADKQTFTVNAKYQKGTATGVTQFGNATVDFRSTSYEWLVVNGQKAQLRGTGTVNGVANHVFTVTAIDAETDTFAIRIWEKTTGAVVFDSGTQNVDGGNITVH
jgi:DNA/RNA endonuclease G (NUC1)